MLQCHRHRLAARQRRVPAEAARRDGPARPAQRACRAVSRRSQGHAARAGRRSRPASVCGAFPSIRPASLRPRSRDRARIAGADSPLLPLPDEPPPAPPSLPPSPTIMMLDTTPILVAGLFGLLVGSFLNVVHLPAAARAVAGHAAVALPAVRIARLARSTTSRSLSWILLGGTCRKCGAPISIQYPIVELVTGLPVRAASHGCTPAGPLLARAAAVRRRPGRAVRHRPASTRSCRTSSRCPASWSDSCSACCAARVA